jgi:hypothetical protein
MFLKNLSKVAQMGKEITQSGHPGTSTPCSVLPPPKRMQLSNLTNTLHKV